jgi:hypothetical protein
MVLLLLPYLTSESSESLSSLSLSWSQLVILVSGVGRRALPPWPLSGAPRSICSTSNGIAVRCRELSSDLEYLQKSLSSEETLLFMLCNRWVCLAASRGREAPGRIKLRGPIVDAKEAPLTAVNFHVSHICTGSFSTAPIMAPNPGLVPASSVKSFTPGCTPAPPIASSVPGAILRPSTTPIVLPDTDFEPTFPSPDPAPPLPSTKL